MRKCFNGFRIDDQEVQLNQVEDSDDQNQIEVNHHNDSLEEDQHQEQTEIPDDTLNFQLEDEEELKKSVQTKSTTYEDRLKQISNTKFKSDKRAAQQHHQRKVSKKEFEQSLILSQKLDSGTSQQKNEEFNKYIEEYQKQ